MQQHRSDPEVRLELQEQLNNNSLVSHTLRVNRGQESEEQTDGHYHVHYLCFAMLYMRSIISLIELSIL